MSLMPRVAAVAAPHSIDQQKEEGTKKCTLLKIEFKSPHRRSLRATAKRAKLAASTE